MAGCGMLFMIYFKQEGMLYVPGQPIQKIEDNPDRYKAPTERGMEYEEIWLTCKDGTKLQGWFIYQKNNCQDKKTMVFFHENAGNIGLRMDFFEMSYKRLDVNWLIVAYRCYSGSDKGPNGDLMFPN